MFYLYIYLFPSRRRLLFGGLALLAGLGLFSFSVALANISPEEPSPRVAGMVDEGFQTAIGTGFDSAALSVATQADGKILVGGWFDRFDETLSPRLARLLPDGTLDADFTAAIGSGFDSAVFAIAVQADGRIVLGGQFTEFNGVPASRLARLHPDGSLDQEFQDALDGGPNGSVYSILEQAEGKLLIGGEFRDLHGLPGIVRLNADGTSNEAFNANLTGALNSPKVFSVAVDRWNRVWLGGDFRSTAGYSGTPGVVRLTSDGAVDTDFGAKLGSALTSVVRTVLPLEAGSFVAGNHFFPDGEDYEKREVLPFGFDPLSLLRQADGKFLGGGSGSFRRISLLGLDRNPDEPFESYYPGIGGSVNGMAIQSDGGIVAAGSFSGSFSGNRISRFQGYTPGEFLWVDGNTLRLVRGGGSPSAYRVVFQASHDGDSWEFLGEATRNGSGWELAGADLEGWTHMRSLAMVRGGYSSGSGSLVAQTISLGGDPQTIAFEAMAPRSMGDDAFVPDATASSGLPVRFISSNAAVAAVNGGRIQIVGTGSTTITAYQAGNDNYLPAAVVSGELTVAVGSQAIAFDTPEPRTFRTTSSPFDLVAHASSGLPVSFSSSNPDIASIDGKRVTIHGAGEVEITATQEGNEHYHAATPVTRTLTIHRSTQSIEFTALDPMPLGRPPLTLEATSRRGSSQTGLPVSFSSSDPSIASIENGAVVPHAIGTVEITAHQEGNEDYLPATPVTRTLHVIEPPTAAGSMDMLFNVNLGTGGSWGIGALALQPDGKILFGGSSSHFNGVEIGHLGRLNPDGSLDEVFRANIGSGFNDRINAVVLQEDGKIVVGGTFRYFSGVSAHRVFRLHDRGHIDHQFRSNMGTGPSHGSIAVLDLALQTDGKLIVAGEFGSFSGHFIGRVVRLQPNGALDEDFLASAGTGANGRIRVIALQSDGKILLGGDFTSFNGIPAPRLVRLLPSGAVDETFLQTIGTGPANIVTTLVTNPDDSILLGVGSSFNGRSVGSLLLLDREGRIVENAAGQPFYDTEGGVGIPILQGDGRLLVPGSVSRVGFRTNLPSGLVRLTEEAELDSIVTSSIGSGVNSSNALLQPDGKIWIAGFFDRFNHFGQIPRSILRLNNDPGAVFLHRTETSLHWTSAGAAPQPQAVLFQAEDGDGEWADLGWGGYVEGDWSLSGLDLSDFALVRAIARIHAGRSSGLLIREASLATDLQQIAIAEIAPRSFPAEPFELDASASSGLPITFFSSNPQVATVEDGVLTAHRPGEATITAVQLGDDSYGAAAPVSRGVVVEHRPQTIEFPELPPKPVGADPLQLTGTASSGLPVSFSSSDSGVASVVDGKLTIHSPGEVKITATQPGNAFYLPADPVERTLTVLEAPTAPGAPDLVFVDRLGDGADAGIFSVAAAADGALFIGGAFFNFDGEATGPLARLTAEGWVDESWSEGLSDLLDGNVFGVHIGRDGSLLVGGEFASNPAEGISRSLARVKADGGWDEEFAAGMGAGVGGTVYGVLELPDGRMLAWGDFSEVDDQPAANLVVFGPDGELYPEFFGTPGVGTDGPVYTAALLRDGDLLLGGEFSLFGGEPADRLVRIGSDGAIVPAFSAAIGNGPNGAVRALREEPGGGILAGGDFTGFDGHPAPHLVRLSGTGRLDRDFLVELGDGPDGPVRSLAVQADGKLLIGGAFSSIGDVDTDGIARLLSHGEVDEEFSERLDLPGNAVTALMLDAGGRVLVAGHDSVSPNLLRLFNDPAAGQLRALPHGMALELDGSAPWPGHVVFEAGEDGAGWSELGVAELEGEAWILSGTFSGQPQIRALADTPGGQGNGSSGVVIYEADLGPQITSALQHMAVAGRETVYQIEASHSPSRFFATGLPAGLSIDGETGLIGGTPVQEGDYEVLVAARNVTGALGNATVAMNVRSATGPLPELASVSHVTIDASTEFSYSLLVESHGVESEVIAVQVPDGLSFNETTRTFTGVLAPGYHLIEVDLVTAYGTVRRQIGITAYAPGTTVSQSGYPNWLHAVTAIDGGYVAVGQTGTVLRSNDAEEWELVQDAEEYTLTGVAYGNGRAVAVGSDGVILSSADGWDWQEEVSGVTSALRRVEFLADLFVAVGDGGVLLVSLDGQSWTRIFNRQTNDLYAVAHGAGRWVAVGSGGAILHSTNGDVWWNATLSVQDHFQGVAFGNGVFVAVASSGAVATSTDGIAWKVSSSPDVGGFRDIAFVQGRFLALAEDSFGQQSTTGRLVSTKEGQDWPTLAEWPMVSFTGISKNADRWVAVGRSGRVLTGPDGVDRIPALTGPKELLLMEGNFVSEPVTYKGVEGLHARDLPPGLQLDVHSGNIIGRPTEAGDFQSYLEAHNAVGPVRPLLLRTTVFPKGGDLPAFTGPLAVNASSSGVVSFTVAVNGLDETSVVTVENLPENLSFNPGTRAIFGTLVEFGLYEVTVRATNIYGTTEDILRISFGHTVAWENGSIDASSNTLQVAHHEGLYVAVAAGGQIVSSTDGINWDMPVSSGSARRDVIFAADLWVVVGDGGQIYTSPDGDTWTLRSAPSNSALYAVAYGNGVFVAVGNSPSAFVSTDGETWEPYPLDLDGALNGIAFGDGRFVAVGQSGQVLTSQDGIAWEPEESGTTNRLGTVAYGHGRFVAGGTGVLMASTTAGQWQTVEQDLVGPASGVRSMTAVSAGFVALSSSRGLLSSPDGIHWTRRTIEWDTPRSTSVLGLAHGEAGYVATDSSGHTGVTAGNWVPVILSETSAFGVAGRPFSFRIPATDGADRFLAEGLPSGLSMNEDAGLIEGVPETPGTCLVKIAAGNEHGYSNFEDLTLLIEPAAGSPPVFVGDAFAEATVNLLFGFTVQLQRMDAATAFSAEGLPPGLAIDPETGAITGRPEAGGVFDAEITASNFYGQSQLPFRFVVQENPWLYKIVSVVEWPYSPSDVAYGSGRYALVGSSGATWHSTDAEDWQLVPPQTSADLRGVVHAAGRFVAVGESGAVLTSEDGLLWTNRFSAVASHLNAIAHSDQLLVAVGVGGVISTSPTGLDWTARLSPTLEELTAVTYGNGIFVAVGRNGVILSSADGVEWEQRDSGTTQPFWSIAYGNGRFVAVGHEATVRISDDGVQWQDLPSTGLGTSAFSIAYGRDDFILIGPGWEVRTSPDGQNWTKRTPYAVYHHQVRYVAGQYFFLYNREVRVTDGHWPPRVIPPGNVTVEKGEPFSLVVEADGVHDSFHAINLPAGLSLNEATGEISGVPEATGDFEVSLYVDGDWGPSALVVTTLSVVAPDLTPPGIGPDRMLLATLGEAFAETLDLTGNLNGAVVSVDGLPEDLDFDQATHLISGTPGSVGDSTLTVTITSPLGNATGSFHLKIVEQIDSTPVPASSTASAVVSYPFSYHPPIPAHIDSVNALGFPAGLTIRASTGQITGIPEEPGIFDVFISGSGESGTLAYHLILEVEYMAPEIISWPSHARANPGETAAFQVLALGSELDYHWGKDSESLHDDGRLTGSRSGDLRIENLVLEDAGNYSVTVSNNRGFFTSAPVTLTIIEAFSAWVERVLPEGTGGWQEDSFGSGIANLLWYALGAETADRNLLPHMVGNGDWLEFHFSRSRSAEGVHLTVEESIDFIDWWQTTAPVEEIGSDGHVDLLRVRVPVTDMPRFFRLKATPTALE